MDFGFDGLKVVMNALNNVKVVLKNALTKKLSNILFNVLEIDHSLNCSESSIEAGKTGQTVLKELYKNRRVNNTLYKI